jgi:hypothetical protein
VNVGEPVIAEAGGARSPLAGESLVNDAGEDDAAEVAAPEAGADATVTGTWLLR